MDYNMEAFLLWAKRGWGNALFSDEELRKIYTYAQGHYFFSVYETYGLLETFRIKELFPQTNNLGGLI